MPKRLYSMTLTNVTQILRQNEDVSLELEEVMQALTIAYEPPTLADLAVLTAIDDTQQLTKLVQRCFPLLQVSESSEYRDRITFTHSEFRDRLSALCHGQAEQKKRYHGSMALRCFGHIQSSYQASGGHAIASDGPASLKRSTTITARVIDESNVLIVTGEDEEPDDALPTASEPSTTVCHYPIKHLYRHLSEGFQDVAVELCDLDPDFWGRDSSLRSGWLKDFQTFTTDLRDLNTSGMSALHVAAGIGANELVSILVDRHGQVALSWTNDDGMTAVGLSTTP